MKEAADPTIPLLCDGPPSAAVTLVLAHGAGAPMDSPFMQAIAEGVGARGIRVVRFEFAYMAARRQTGKRAPPERMPALEARFRAVVSQLAPKRLFVGGKSMGSRVAVHVADAVGARGVIALGYPFHPPARPKVLRVAPLHALEARCAILQGTRDRLGTPAEIARYRLPAHIAVHYLADGDHDLAPRVRSGRTHAQNLAEAVAHIAAFVRAKRSLRGA
jgi:uncharacterized protein